MNIRVIDPFTIKPLDAATIVASARATQGKVITVEDHYKEGKQFSGLGVAVLWLFFFLFFFPGPEWAQIPTSEGFIFLNELFYYEEVLVMLVMTV